MNIIEKLIEIGVCTDAIDWVQAQPDQSEAALWANCPRGDWMLWFAARTTSHDLRPVAYRAANRALKYAATAFDSAGIPHTLDSITINSTKTARDAELAVPLPASPQARAAGVTARAAAHASWAAREEVWVSVWSAARAAAWSVETTNRAPVRSVEAAAIAAQSAELLLSANDCRELLK